MGASEDLSDVPVWRLTLNAPASIGVCKVECLICISLPSVVGLRFTCLWRWPRVELRGWTFGAGVMRVVGGVGGQGVVVGDRVTFDGRWAGERRDVQIRLGR